MADLPLDIGAVLPQTGVARLLTAVTSCRDGVLRATAAIPVEHPLCVGQKAPSYLGVEMGAQAAAAMEAIQRATWIGATPAVRGRLVRVREATLCAPHLPVDSPLQVTAQLEGAAPPVAIYQIEVAVQGNAVVRAVISTYDDTTDGPGPKS